MKEHEITQTTILPSQASVLHNSFWTHITDHVHRATSSCCAGQELGIFRLPVLASTMTARQLLGTTGCEKGISEAQDAFRYCMQICIVLFIRVQLLVDV